MMRELRSPKVRKIVALRGQAARVLKGTLTDRELRELRRAWSGV